MTTFHKILMTVALMLTSLIANEAIVLASTDGESHSEYNFGKQNFKTECSKFELIDAVLNRVPPTSTAVGIANVKIGDDFFEAAASLNLLGEPQPQPDGTANILVQIQFDFGDGEVLLALARGVLSGTDIAGVFNNNAIISFLGGFGSYEKAYGRFDATGIVNFADFIVELQGQGALCNI